MTKVIGQTLPRIDAKGKVTGETLYSGDISIRGMLHMKILFAGRPHARVLRIDASAAESCPGVAGVFTARDVPVNEYGLQINDQPVLCGPGGAGRASAVKRKKEEGKPGADIVRFVGDQVAAVAAETEQVAAEALKLIQVEYEDLPVLTDPVAAMQAGANAIHPQICAGKILVHAKIRKGNGAAGFSRADVIRESENRVPAPENT